ncbi:MAG: fimbrial outer membrane usher protein [Pseudomonas sp.]
MNMSLQSDRRRASRPRFSRSLLAVAIAASCGIDVHATSADTADWHFDPSLLAGATYGVQIDKFNTVTPNGDAQPEAGQMALDVELNGTLVATSHVIRFADDDQGQVQPCMDEALLNLLQIRRSDIAPVTAGTVCLPFPTLGLGGSWRYEPARLRLNFVIPQKHLLRMPKGFIPQAEWDPGITALWLRHNSNYYRSSYSGRTYQNAWSLLNSGINVGLWQFRNQSSARYLKRAGEGGEWHWQNTRTWVTRPLPSLESQLTLGDAYSDSGLFGSLSYRGVKLSTDKRMWPQGRLGYAPTVQGVATTPSHVIVRQQGKVIYETTVAPGGFVIDDLYDTRNKGDLDVDVVGSDGVTHSFSVPYSQIADSMRPGASSYALGAGQVRGFSGINDHYAEATYQLGLSNQLTANTGLRLGENYAALLGGGVWGSELGAFGLNATWSHATLADDSKSQGWRAEASYSKVFDTGTNLVLAAYRFSTEGFRDLQDVLGEREAARRGYVYSSYTLQQRNRLAASLNQNMGQWGTISVNASTADYYANRARQTQFQLGYTKSWRDVTLNVTASRQLVRNDTTSYYFGYDVLSGSTSNLTGSHNENTAFISLTFPLESGRNHSTATVSASRSRYANSTNVSWAGTAGEDRSLSWSVNGTRDRYRGDYADYNSSNWGGSLQGNTPYGAWRTSYAQGSDTRQYSLGGSGTLVAHEGGVTLGPWSGDTFALVKAEGAQGASIQNGRGATIGRSGYALLPALTPYRYNTVALDTGRMSLDAELVSSSQRVVPYAGALLGLRFETIHGRAALITTQLPDGTQPPMGADVFDAQGTSLGLVGQGGQIYARLPADQGLLRVQWGDGADEQCRVSWDIAQQPAGGIVNVNLPCTKD